MLNWLLHLFTRDNLDGVTPIASGVLAAPKTMQTKEGRFANMRNPHSGGQITVAVLPPGKGYDFEVVGESRYQSVLQAWMIWAKNDREQPVIIRPEPENQYDRNAVAVQTLEGRTIGYFSRDKAAAYHPVLLALNMAGATCVCDARVFGGTPDKPNFGVWLNLAQNATDIVERFDLPA